MKTYKSFKNKLLKNKGIKKAHDELGPEFAFLSLAILQKSPPRRFFGIIWACYIKHLLFS